MINRKALSAATEAVDLIMRSGKRVSSEEFALVVMQAAIPHLTTKNTVKVPAADSPEAAPWHDFWSLYPRKQGKGAAEVAFWRAADLVGTDVIIDGLRKYVHGSRLDPKYTPMAQRWLNERRWEDEPIVELKPGRIPVGDGNRDHWDAGSGFGMPRGDR